MQAAILSPETAPVLTGREPATLRAALGLMARIRIGTLDITLPDGRRLQARGAAPGPHAHFIVHHPGFARRLAFSGDLGFAEAYLRGEWDTPDLASFLELFARNYELIAELLPDRPLPRLWQRFRHFLNRNTRLGARRNIHAHYDLGNRFYETWLDSSMTYSSALFAPGDNDLASAQRRKYAALADRLGLKPGDHVLEIGCGWGGFAEYAAGERGCRVTGLTISREQLAYATERMAAQGLSDRVTLKLQDYRDETGRYDAIASIEMFEAVGEAYWPVYFQTLARCLKPGARAGLQVITIREESFRYYKNEIDFIRAYIFPGGMLPTPTHMRDLGRNAGLPLADDVGFGGDYARTLALWHERFLEAWDRIRPLGFDERFRRMWRYYLAYCEAGFRTGNIDVRQMVFSKG